MKTINKYIYITTKFEGFHKYIDAPEEVSYLRNKHRHLFGVKVKIEVFTNDREIEFIMFKHKIEEYIKRFSGDNDALSCEMMAEEIYNYVKGINCILYNRKLEVIVNEDEENGAVVGDF